MTTVATRDYGMKHNLFKKAAKAAIEIFCYHDDHAPDREDDPGKPRLITVRLQISFLTKPNQWLSSLLLLLWTCLESIWESVSRDAEAG